MNLQDWSWIGDWTGRRALLTPKTEAIVDNIHHKRYTFEVMDRRANQVARLLLEMSEEVEGKNIIKQRLTQRDIASMVGASREMVSRILRDLSIGGYITIENKQITLNERLPAAW